MAEFHLKKQVLKTPLRSISRNKMAEELQDRYKSNIS